MDGDQEILRLRFPNLKMSVRLADFITLSNGALLNDTIVDFYLNHIVENVLPDCGSSQIFVLPSLFWHRLRTSSNPLEEFSVGINKESGICFTKEYRTYINFWINEVNIFEASFIVIPVIEQSHWMLVIVCLPSDFLGAMERGSVSDGDLKLRGGTTRRPKMIFFDSQQKTGDSNLVNGVCTTVRQLLMVRNSYL
ncbi:unnamed protein product [Anisakis simplex]|uniref:Ubiquitin-like protease family profile domain-containing protein n=1 Tax=Anisakis simplex TaxID=6269 RepID=A0A3P6NJ50_ANISI|nr:unnamed protein product [Anisakis simplex]